MEHHQRLLHVHRGKDERHVGVAVVKDQPTVRTPCSPDLVVAHVCTAVPVALPLGVAEEPSCPGQPEPARTSQLAPRAVDVGLEAIGDVAVGLVVRPVLAVALTRHVIGSFAQLLGQEDSDGSVHQNDVLPGLPDVWGRTLGEATKVPIKHYDYVAARQATPGKQVFHIPWPGTDDSVCGRLKNGDPYILTRKQASGGKASVCKLCRSKSLPGYVLAIRRPIEPRSAPPDWEKIADELFVALRKHDLHDKQQQKARALYHEAKAREGGKVPEVRLPQVRKKR